MRRRRTVNVLGMSFLDVMFCGFGSVILLVMLMHGETVRQREPVRADLRAEVGRLERAVADGDRRVAGLERSLEEAGAARERPGVPRRLPR